MKLVVIDWKDILSQNCEWCMLQDRWICLLGTVTFYFYFFWYRWNFENVYWWSLLILDQPTFRSGASALCPSVGLSLDRSRIGFSVWNSCIRPKLVYSLFVIVVWYLHLGVILNNINQSSICCGRLVRRSVDWLVGLLVGWWVGVE